MLTIARRSRKSIGGVGHYRLYVRLRRGSDKPESPNFRYISKCCVSNLEFTHTYFCMIL